MGIYGHRFDDFIYENNLIQLNNMIEETSFIEELTEETVLTESVVSNIIENIKKLVRKVIDFLKSIPGKLKDLYNKFIAKKKEQEIIYTDYTTGKSFNESKEFPGELYDYDLLCNQIAYKLTNLFTDYQDIITNISNLNSDKFESMINNLEQDDKKMESEFNLEKYKIKNKNSKFLRDHEDDFEFADVSIDGAISDIKKLIEYYTELYESLDKYKFDKEKEAEKVDALNHYKAFVTRSSTMCNKYMQLVSKYASDSWKQYLQIAKFLESCWESKQE